MENQNWEYDFNHTIEIQKFLCLSDEGRISAYQKILHFASLHSEIEDSM